MSQFLEDDKIKLNTNYRELLTRIWPYVRRNLGLFVTVLAAIALLAGISRVLPAIIGYAIDHGFRQKNEQILLGVAVAYLAVEILKTFLTFVHRYLFQILGSRVLGLMRADLLDHVLRLPMDYFHRNPSGRTVTRMTNDISVLSEVFSDGVVSLLTQSAVLISIAVAMSFMSLKVTFLTLVTVPLFIYANLFIVGRIKIVLRDQKKKLSEINSFISEHLSGIKVAQLYNQIPTSEKKFFQLSNEYRTLNMKSIKGYALMQPVLNLMNAAVVCSALFWAGREYLHDALPIGIVVTFVLNAQDMIPPIREILDKYQMFQNSLTSAERVFALFDESPEPVEVKSAAKDLRLPIRIENLSFRYAPELPFAIENLNLNIPAGTSLALVGRTGSGKSTIVSLLQKFYLPPEKTIWIGDTPLERMTRLEIRNRVGVIQQDPFIFKGTIRDNILLGDQTLSLNRLLEAAQEIGFLEYLTQSGRSLDDKVDEKGANLSLGERQVVSFLRLMVRNPDIMILDEATANIDSMTEALIARATQKALEGRTSIVVAHRLSTIQECDQIAVLDHGRLIELGSPQKLLNTPGSYFHVALEV
ncbi:MAG: ABC transporter ATP-binding protein [Bdellovibrionaceae bacterium]|nr:ABC transporter ATP-binding protein [Pseudobdellovibrionaceae bacterium]